MMGFYISNYIKKNNLILVSLTVNMSPYGNKVFNNRDVNSTMLFVINDGGVKFFCYFNFNWTIILDVSWGYVKFWVIR